MKNCVVLSLLAISFSLGIISAHSQGLVSREIVYVQPYKFKIDPFASYVSLIAMDSVSGNKMVALRTEKKVTFMLLDKNWKQLNSFETSVDKKSPYATGYITLANSTVQGDVWTTIVDGSGGYAVEKIDFASKQYQFIDKIFEDKNKHFHDRSFLLNGNNYTLYVTKKGDVNMAIIDKTGKVQVTMLDLSMQVTRGGKKFKPEEVIDNISRMGGGLVEMPELTRKKFLFYTQYENFVITAVYEQPFAELIYYDWKTSAKVRSDIFSVKDLLPGDAKNADLNTTVLLHDDKVWVMSAYKNGGVLGVFDRTSKKLLYHFLYDEKTAKDVFSYGPVFYKATPGTVSGFKEKLEDVSMDFFCKEVFKRNTALTIHHLKQDECIVSLGAYDELTVSVDNWKRMGPSLTGGFPEITTAGLTFQNKDLKPINFKTSYNELTNANLTKKPAKSKKPIISDADPEYAQKKANLLSTVSTGTGTLVLYLYDDQFKIMELIYE